MNELQRLHADFNQSPWLDYINRDFLETGKLAGLVDQGIRGLTSNPTIFEQAILSGAYDETIRTLSGQGVGAEDIYWTIAKEDITEASKLLLPVYEQSDGTDGFVSLEVSPAFVHDTDATLTQARELWTSLNVPNLMIKVPATPEGIPAIRQLISEGINVNATLIFSLAQYKDVFNAYIDGVIASDYSKPVHSVASFFISRVDTDIDAQLDAIGTPEAIALKGKAALAQGHIAYDIYASEFNHGGSRWYALAGEHADISRQRLLWASTGVKNPDYDQLLYVTGLIADNSVNTLPLATIDYMLENAPEVQSTITPEMAATAITTLRLITEQGVDIEETLARLTREGIDKFQKSFASLISAIEKQKP